MMSVVTQRLSRSVKYFITLDPRCLSMMGAISYGLRDLGLVETALTKIASPSISGLDHHGFDPAE